MNEIVSKKFRVDKVIFYNIDSKWGALGVSSIDPLGDLEYDLINAFGSIGISGNFEGVYEGAEIEVSGDIIVNPKYGKQIQIRKLRVLQDTKTQEGVINFLARSMIKGISVQNATKIYNAFGQAAIDTTINSPERLMQISGIGAKTVAKIKESVTYYKRIEKLVDFCTNLGISYSVIIKLDEELKDSALSIIKEDPFKILDIAKNIPFKQVDEIYLKCNGDPKGKKRLETALLYVLRNLAMLEGSTGCKSSSVRSRFYKLLNLPEEEQLYEKTAHRLENEDKVLTSEGALSGLQTGIIYYKEYLDIEKNIAEKVSLLNTYGVSGKFSIKEDIVEEEMHNFPFTLNKQQVNAVKTCLKDHVTVLTGSAGCITGDSEITLNGKTKTIKELFLSWHKGKNVEVISLLEDGVSVGPNVVEYIVYSGKKPVFLVSLEDGKTLRATSDHLVMTKSGFIPVASLSSDSYVMTVVDNNVSYSKVLTIEPSGVEDTFDICCYENHNFVANGILIHNSGKSSITKALYRIYSRCGFQVDLLSPTAKACRRLEECTGGQAQTVHSFLGMDMNGNVTQPFKIVDNVIIVDEASMLDIILFNHLLDKASPTTRIILVGDNNQLPSVQAGNVLGDLISSGKVKVAILTDVMRQKGESHIIKYCTMANNGEIFDPCEYEDFHYEEFGTGKELREFFVDKYLKEVEENGLSEVQVISPYKKGELGMDNLNSILQSSYNKEGKEIPAPFRVGDRVRHTQNDYKKNVYNGETGVILDPSAYHFPTVDDDDDEIIVDYGNKIIRYEKTELDTLTLSYCSTVHASQGSEYAICFIILDDTATNDFLLIRRLLYTALSRGKKKVYVLAKPYLVDKCISNNSYRPRITRLKDYLKTINVSYTV